MHSVVDVLIVEFPAHTLGSSLARQVAALTTAGDNSVRVLDALIARVDEHGRMHEVTQGDVLPVLAPFIAPMQRKVFSIEDLENDSSIPLHPNTAILVVMYETLWTTMFAVAAYNDGARVIRRWQISSADVDRHNDRIAAEEEQEP